MFLCAMGLAAPLTVFGAATEAQVGNAYKIYPGDLLEISVWKEDELHKSVLVRPDGKISLPLAGEVDAAGRTVTDVQQSIVGQLQRYIPDPVVTVTVAEIRGYRIYVIGQVNSPGMYIALPKLDVMQALSLAGGTTAFASLNDIIILRRVNGVQRSIPFNYSDIAKGRHLEQNVLLANGDVVVVP